MTEKILLTDRDVKSIYGIPCSTQVKGQMKHGVCPHISGSSVHFPKSNLDNYLASLRRRSSPDPSAPDAAPERAD